jgi:hypothetical protein
VLDIDQVTIEVADEWHGDQFSESREWIVLVARQGRKRILQKANDLWISLQRCRFVV